MINCGHFVILRTLSGVNCGQFWNRKIERNLTAGILLSIHTRSARVGHPFFSKERSVLSVLFRSFLKNGTFFPFFSVLFKRTERSFRSFPFFSKERNILSIIFRFLQKNVPFFPFSSVPLKRMERSFYVLFLT